MRVTDGGVPVQALISVVKDSIKRAGISRASQDRDLQVASVQLILDVVAAKTAGGGLDFRVPFIGMKLRVGGSHQQGHAHYRHHPRAARGARHPPGARWRC